VSNLSGACLAASDPQVPMESSARRRNVLRQMEIALTTSRAAAAAIDHPTLAYFIDMAILEVRSSLTGEEGSLA
jgi:hypothetical protein